MRNSLYWVLGGLIGTLCIAPMAMANNCMQKAVTTAQMTQCQQQQAQAQEKALNAVSQKILKELPAKDKARFSTSGKAWTQFRELECQFQSGMMQDSATAALVRQQCLGDVTERRTQQLQEFLHNL